MIKIQCDSLSVVQVLNSRGHPLSWECARVLWSIVEAKTEFIKSEFIWIPRSVNFCAHMGAYLFIF